MIRSCWRGLLVGVVSLACLPDAGIGQGLPSLNLGFTSFLDGGPPAGPGFYFQEYLQYYHAGKFNDQHGDEVPILDGLNVGVSLNQLIYQSDQGILFGGKWGIDVIVPLVSIDVNQGTIPILTTNHQGLGDLTIGPFIQWDPIMGKDGPIFVHRIEFQNLVPTGKYDDDKVLNPGSNFYSFNPYWAGTLFILPGWEATWRLHYLWNDKNGDPNKTLFPHANDTQAGQATHVNFTSSYNILPHQIWLGMNGYYLKQFTNAEVDGNGVPNSREQVLGFGPGALYSFSPDDHIFFNAYIETAAENRPQGMRLNLRWTHHF